MLEDRLKVGNLKAVDIYREVEPIAPYPRINPQPRRQEDQVRIDLDKRAKTNPRSRRRFTAMRQLIDLLKKGAPIARVDFNTANREVHEQGLVIAEEHLINQLLHLKIPLKSIEELVQQLRRNSAGLRPTTGRILTAGAKLFPVHVEGLSEYLLRFEELPIHIGEHASGIFQEINAHGRCIVEHNRMKLDFRSYDKAEIRSAGPLRLAISIQIGAIEIDENGRRAILYKRSDQTYALYSDKSISLAI